MKKRRALPLIEKPIRKTRVLNRKPELLEIRKRSIEKYDISKDEVVQSILNYFNIKSFRTLVTSPDRMVGKMNYCRHIIIYYICFKFSIRNKQGRLYRRKKPTDLTLIEIGAQFYLENHVTVIHARDKIKGYLEKDIETKKIFSELNLNN